MTIVFTSMFELGIQNDNGYNLYGYSTLGLAFL